MEIPSEIPFDLVAEAVEVGPAGAGEVGWCRKDALAVLHKLDDTKVSIGEGEVYEPAPGGFVVADNWHCAHIRGETATEYANRSRADACGFIEGYEERDEQSAIFVMLFSDQQDAA